MTKFLIFRCRMKDGALENMRDKYALIRVCVWLSPAVTKCNTAVAGKRRIERATEGDHPPLSVRARRELPFSLHLSLTTSSDR